MWRIGRTIGENPSPSRIPSVPLGGGFRRSPAQGSVRSVSIDKREKQAFARDQPGECPKRNAATKAMSVSAMTRTPPSSTKGADRELVRLGKTQVWAENPACQGALQRNRLGPSTISPT